MRKPAVALAADCCHRAEMVTAPLASAVASMDTAAGPMMTHIVVPVANPSMAVVMVLPPPLAEPRSPTPPLGATSELGW